ncbi:MAG TPA: BTAD domain-containing putative transcriptional regulator [Diaminobutyricibacter sp.]
MDSSTRPQPRVAVLGPVLVEDRSGSLAEPSGTLGKSLIVSLVLARGSVSVPSLVEDLWDDAPPRQERAALQTLVSRVRTASADGILESTAGGYALAVPPEHTDLGLARALLERARAAELAGDPARAANDATAALALWRGEPGAELGPTPLASELERAARSLRSDLLHLRARSRRAQGDTAAALADLDPLLAASPLDEGLQRELLLTLDAAGRRNDAIRAFDDFRSRLREALGTRPGPELVALNASLLVEETSPGPAVVSRSRIGLRTAPNALIGREYDLEAVEDLVATGRLTTILGAGGLGKTRLAQEIGNRAVHTPAVIVLELASVRTGDDIGLAIASTLGIREARSTRIQSIDPNARVDLRSRILSMLAERETLLIVDNCEHIVDAAAAWISDILDSTTNVRILATSRAPLAISAERVYPLDSLTSGLSPTDIVPSTPAPADVSSLGPAVALFVERARAARPAVVLPLDVVVRLCDRLDGLPLAIELAAARIRSMSVEEVERRLKNRFALLTSGERTAPERHRTLLAVIDWSWNLLTDPQRALLRRLSRFPDGFSAEAAEIVAGSGTDGILDDLDALVNQSLVSVSEDAATGILRYRMLETVREFGDIVLIEAGETDLVRDRMYDWARTFSSHALAHLNGAEQVHTFQLVTSEQDNLVSVLRSALDGARPDVVATVFAALAYYWTLRSAHSEVIAFGPTVISALRGYEPEPAETLEAAATYAVLGATFLYFDSAVAGRALARLKRLKKGGAALPDTRLEALTNLVLAAGRPVEGFTLLTEYKASPDPATAAMATLISAQFHENAGELDEAIVEAERSYALSVQLEDTWGQASAAQGLTQLHSQLANRVAALEWAVKAEAGLTALNADGDLRQLEWLVAMCAVATGDIERGRPILERFATDDAESLGFDFLDLRAIGRSGLAEIDLADGRIGTGLSQYRDAVAVYSAPGSAPVPWQSIVAAACIIAHIRAGFSDYGVVDGLAKELRTRILVQHRMQPGFVDRPVLGSAVAGLAAWLLWERGDAEPTADRVEAGIELFGLAARLNSRQDLRSLERSILERELREAWGDEAVGRALSSAGALTRDDAVDRVIDLLGRAARQ